METLIAKHVETELWRPLGNGPWTLTVVFASAEGVTDPELLQLGLDAVYRRVRQLPPRYLCEDLRKEAKDGHAQAD
jgi:hypothetical protein